MGIIGVGAAHNFFQRRRGRVAVGEGGVALIYIGVILGRHVAAAAPAFVSYSPPAHFVGFGVAVFAALQHQRGVVVRVEVFHPTGHFLHRAAAHVGGQVGLGIQQLAQLQKFVGAEAVILQVVAPPHVQHLRALRRGPDAVAPVVGVGEAAAGPAQVGHLDFLQRLHHVQPDAALLGHVQLFIYPKTIVNAAAQMLSELPVDVPADLQLRAAGLHGHLHRRGLR